MKIVRFKIRYLAAALALMGAVVSTGCTKAELIGKKSLLAKFGVFSVQPPYGPMAGNTTVTITGNGFKTGAAVTIGGVVCNNVVVYSPQMMTCVTSSSTPGSATVEVTVPGVGTSTAANSYTYLDEIKNFSTRISAGGSYTLTGGTGAGAIHATTTVGGLTRGSGDSTNTLTGGSGVNQIYVVGGIKGFQY